jgi:CRISPR-associated endonuclease Csn1
LNQRGLISDEKYKRLTRSTGFTEEEKYEFINRQLVETRQSTKVVASLLKEIYPETVIVYVKAGLVSDFRQQFDLLKSRVVNDLHHAKDAYLSIVVGNVWYHKFSRQFWRAGETHNAKPEVVFTHAVKVGDRVVWNGATDKDRVVRIARKNTAHMTLYPYLNHSGQNGGFFDQNPLRAKAGLIPLKKNMPTEIYGGYDSATIAGFVLVRYRIGKKAEASLIPLKYLHLKQYLENDLFASQYVAEELGAKASGIEILLNGRIMKIGTMISLDGARFCIRGKANLTSIGLMNMMPFMTSYDLEVYIKKLEVFDRKRQKNANIVWDEGHDGISREGNAVLYSVYVDKLSKWPYNKRPGIGTLVEKLRKRKNEFLQLDVIQQTSVLLQVQGILGRMKQADLERLSESSSSGIAKLSLNVSNWQKNYTDVRIIDQSASGLFEKISEVNLLELL